MHPELIAYYDNYPPLLIDIVRSYSRIDYNQCIDFLFKQLDELISMGIEDRKALFANSPPERRYELCKFLLRVLRTPDDSDSWPQLEHDITSRVHDVEDKIRQLLCKGTTYKA